MLTLAKIEAIGTPEQLPGRTSRGPTSFPRLAFLHHALALALGRHRSRGLPLANPRRESICHRALLCAWDTSVGKNAPKTRHSHKKVPSVPKTELARPRTKNETNTKASLLGPKKAVRAPTLKSCLAAAFGLGALNDLTESHGRDCHLLVQQAVPREGKKESHKEYPRHNLPAHQNLPKTGPLQTNRG